jgi:hypothetical protein
MTTTHDTSVRIRITTARGHTMHVGPLPVSGAIALAQALKADAPMGTLRSVTIEGLERLPDPLDDQPVPKNPRRSLWRGRAHHA